MPRLALPHPEDIRAFGGRPCFSALLDILNKGSDSVRVEVKTGENESWQVVIPGVPPGESWASTRQLPLWIPRMASLRLVRNSDNEEVLQRSPWGDGGSLKVETP